jgi:hypothetical protein
MADNRNYVPLLRWKRGEQVALSQLTDEACANITPLIMLANDQFKPRKATAKIEARTAAKAFADEVKSVWGDEDFMLYAGDLTVEEDEAHPLYAIGEQATEAGLALVPVVWLDDPDDYKIAAVNVANEGRGRLALRVELADLDSASEWAALVTPENTDLVIDFADKIEMAASLGGVLGDALAWLHAGAAWRSVTIAGSSIPDDFTGVPAGAHRIARQELTVWRALGKRARPLPYQVFFGDYATISPNSRAPGVRWGYPINVKYTLADDFLICRGVRTLGLPSKGGKPAKTVPTMDMGPQLIGHAKTIVALPGRGPLADCWGDAQIDQIAAETIRPGGLAEWVQYSVNRHIELTVRQVG